MAFNYTEVLVDSCRSCLGKILERFWSPRIMHGKKISRFMPKTKVSAFDNFEVGSLKKKKMTKE